MKFTELNFKNIIKKNPDLEIDHHKYNINVTSQAGEPLSKQQVLSEFSSFQSKNDEAHIYFHLPLCNYICKFCNYVKRKVATGETFINELNYWVQAWQWEANEYLLKFHWIKKLKITSVYFGGGTAALLSPDQINQMVLFIKQNYNLIENAEISLEGNPDNFTSTYLHSAIDSGINRFSIGVQSLDDNVLKFTGRGHSALDAIKSIAHLANTGLPFNVDYMFGLPYQSPKGVRDDIKKLIELGCPTITIYRLRNADREKMGIGNQSAWNRVIARNKSDKDLVFPSPSETYRMREMIIGKLIENGYSPSPCGWWSKPGTYPNGNIPKVSATKWQNYKTMLAYGPGVYGWVTDGPTSLQTHNVTDISKYKENFENNILPLAGGKKLEGYQSLATRLGFALKANQPISIKFYMELFGINLFKDAVTGPVLNDLKKRCLIDFINKDFFKLSTSGEFLHEEIISEFIHGKIGQINAQFCKKTSWDAHA